MESKYTRPQIIKAIGESARAIRERQGMSQQSLADALGKDVGWVESMEDGGVDMSVSEAVILSMRLGVSFDVLMDLDPYMAATA